MTVKQMRGQERKYCALRKMASPWIHYSIIQIIERNRYFIAKSVKVHIFNVKSVRQKNLISLLIYEIWRKNTCI
jgi:hypothetical protein